MGRNRMRKNKRAVVAKWEDNQKNAGVGERKGNQSGRSQKIMSEDVETGH